MTLYSYVKSPVITVHALQTKSTKPKLISFNGFIAKLLLLAGLLLLLSAVGPILFYELFTAPNLKSQQFLSPLPVAGIGKQTLVKQSLPVVNYTQPQAWFPQAGFPRSRESKITHYTLSIPKFKIEDAVVAVGGRDLSQYLIQYPQTALPGELGATVILGIQFCRNFSIPKTTYRFSLLFLL
jgi:hypothetical protein